MRLIGVSIVRKEHVALSKIRRHVADTNVKSTTPTIVHMGHVMTNAKGPTRIINMSVSADITDVTWGTAFNVSNMVPHMIVITVTPNALPDVTFMGKIVPTTFANQMHARRVRFIPTHPVILRVVQMKRVSIVSSSK